MIKKKNTTVRKPEYEVFQVLETSKDKSYWNRIGAAWVHEDGDGLSVTLNAMPLDGRIIIRAVKADKA
jgi:hypothetical protein